MKWGDLAGRTIVAVTPTRAGMSEEDIPNVLHLRFSDGSAAIICCDWASHEMPWLSLDADVEGNDPWLPEFTLADPPAE